MTSDRELLELAAKAAGLDGVYVERERMIREFIFKKFQYIQTNGAYWNPLTDDGDALRLAVKLRIDITFNELDVFAFPTDGSDGKSETINVDDPCAATRRAIVRAAAEIGKEMK